MSLAYVDAYVECLGVLGIWVMVFIFGDGVWGGFFFILGFGYFLGKFFGGGGLWHLFLIFFYFIKVIEYQGIFLEVII